MTNIDYYMFPLSPFSYLAGLRLEEIAKNRECTITYKPFDLLKVFAETGTLPPGQRHESRKAYRTQELSRIAKRNDLPINLTPAHWPTNPVPACIAILNAQEDGSGDVGGFVHGIMRACWAEEKDIATDEVIRATLEAHGFDAALADRNMVGGAETYERNTNDALAANVFGAPSYVVGDQVYWGQDRLDYLDADLAD